MAFWRISYKKLITFYRFNFWWKYHILKLSPVLGLFWPPPGRSKWPPLSPHLMKRVSQPPPLLGLLQPPSGRLLGSLGSNLSHTAPHFPSVRGNLLWTVAAGGRMGSGRGKSPPPLSLSLSLQFLVASCDLLLLGAGDGLGPYIGMYMDVSIPSQFCFSFPLHWLSILQNTINQSSWYPNDKFSQR